jgi:uncharacterized protein YndB with AHSA1/START domain
MKKPETCGQGLAERSALPATLGALAVAMADTLEQHRRTLDLSDQNAKAEDDAYEAVASALGNAAAQLQVTADRMVGYRELPMGRHHEGALASAEIHDGFARFIEREQDLSLLLNTWIQQDRAMLGHASARADSSSLVASPHAESFPLTRVPVVKTGMLIRKPVNEVFEAIVNPKITTNFWFTKSSGRLEVGKSIQWNWEMYNVSIHVVARVIEPNARVVVEWPGYSGPTTVEWRFAPQQNGTTFVAVTESGFSGIGDELAKYVADSTQGFALMLAGLKAFLEHGVRLNLTADRYPQGIDEQELTTASRGRPVDAPAPNPKR